MKTRILEIMNMVKLLTSVQFQMLDIKCQMPNVNVRSEDFVRTQ